MTSKSATRSYQQYMSTDYRNVYIAQYRRYQKVFALEGIDRYILRQKLL